MTSTQPRPPRPPGATYRLQLREGVTFQVAMGLVPYLHGLGVTDLYVSPIFAARAGSTHGYDVVDPTRVDPVLGTEDDLHALSSALRNAGMGLLIDIVPNHLSTSTENPWWRDVLRHGRASEFADYFDIDWQPAGRPELTGRVLLPILGCPLDDAIAAGELQLVGAAVPVGGHRDTMRAETVLRYFETELPLAPGTNVDAPVIDVLAQQHYVLEYWRSGGRRVNWRRFFGLSELVGVRVEHGSVFDATHALILRLVDEGIVTGLRVDHIDGLRDPQGYLERLQRRCGGDPPRHRFPIVVEKILGQGETLPEEWPVLGTTGYEFVGSVNALFIDGDATGRLVDVYERFTGDRRSFGEIVETAKRRMLDDLFPADVDRVVARRRTEGGGDEAIRRQLLDETVALDVYRTYRRDADAPEWVLEWQQLTGGVTAKAVEDTAFYAHVPLLSLNEVGAGAELGGDPVGRFHRAMDQRSRRSPHGLTTTATHDTKLGEDARVRLDVLSEMPDDWVAALGRWHDLAARHTRTVDDQPAPDAVDETRLYQALLAVWPASESGALEPAGAVGAVERIRAYLLKAAREAKRRTSWHEVDEAYEAALVAFVDGVVHDPTLLHDLGSFARRVAWHGMLNSLAQVVLKVASPGAPDLYQGAELWDLSLVDPDNRRPVDFDLRRRTLDALDPTQTPVIEALATWYNGSVKLAVTAAALRARRRDPSVFERGDYVPVGVRGEYAGHLVAFLRREGDRWALAVVPRLTASLAPVGRLPCGASVWRDTALVLPDDAPQRWTDALTAHAIDLEGGSVAGVLASFPVALLVAGGHADDADTSNRR